MTFFWSANFTNSDIGSAPGERTKIIGVLFVESENDLAKSNGGGVIYFLPSSLSFLINFYIAGITLSGLKILKTIALLKRVKSFHWPGQGSLKLCGFIELNTFSQSCKWASNYLSKP